MAFTVDNVTRLTGLSARRLRDWEHKDLWQPSHAGDRRPRSSQLYSPRDVVVLRLLARLRDECGVSLQELRRVSDWLHENDGVDWSDLKFYLIGNIVFFDDPPGNETFARRGMQPVVPFSLADIAADIENAAGRLRERRPELIGRIEQHRSVLHNTPVVAGTRIPTVAIRNLANAGYDDSAILREFPRLTLTDISAALAFEADRAE